MTVRALRYYESVGLVVPARLPNGYRDYDAAAVRAVEEIRALTRLGLSVEATRPFIECLASGHGAGDECPASLSAYRHAIDQLTERIAQLVQRRDALAAHLEDAAARAMPSAPRSAPLPHCYAESSGAHDGGFAPRLVGMRMRTTAFHATDGSTVDLGDLGQGRTVIYVYPLTGRPGVDLPESWDTIPGARGCTAEACGFRDHYGELRAAGAARVYGLSSQSMEYQRELVDRLQLPFAMLSDPSFALAGSLALPTFDTGDMTLYRRLTLIVMNGVVEHVFWPVQQPERHAVEVLDWLRDQR